MSVSTYHVQLQTHLKRDADICMYKLGITMFSVLSQFRDGLVYKKLARIIWICTYNKPHARAKKSKLISADDKE